MALLDVGQGQDPVGGGQGSVVAPEKQNRVSKVGLHDSDKIVECLILVYTL